MCDKEDKKDMDALANKKARRSFKNEKRNIKPKVENGKVLLDKNNSLHRYIFNDGEC